MNDERKIVVPEPVVNNRENQRLLELTKEYEKMIAPDPVQELGKKLIDKVPGKIKDVGVIAKDKLTSFDLTQKCIEVIKSGYGLLEQQANNLSVGETAVIASANDVCEENEILSLEDICLVRSYDIEKTVLKYKKQNLGYAVVEGTVTGAIGAFGIPFSLVLTIFLYYRAVQSIAMFYGYDVKNNPDELVIAGSVFTNGMNPKGSSVDEISRVINKIMNMTETTMVRKTAAKTWADMASRGGITLLITQLRALANSAAKQALESVGKKSLEGTLFEKIFEQVGKQLSQQFVRRATPLVGSVLGAYCDASDMNKVINYANVFYHKRFILEKQERIDSLLGKNSEN